MSKLPKTPLTEHSRHGSAAPNLHRTICRWLRAFHAALYREYLPDNDGTKDGTRLSFDPPFPIGHVDENGEIKVDAIRPHHTFFVEQIKRNRLAGQLDRIICFNGKCVYECVWDKADDGQPICIFALNVYDWSALANTDDFPRERLRWRVPSRQGQASKCDHRHDARHAGLEY